MQWFLGLRRLLLRAVADKSISVWQVQVECDEWTMLHAQSTQGGAINLQHRYTDQNNCTTPDQVSISGLVKIKNNNSAQRTWPSSKAFTGISWCVWYLMRQQQTWWLSNTKGLPEVWDFWERASWFSLSCFHPSWSLLKGSIHKFIMYCLRGFEATSDSASLKFTY